MKRQTRCRKYLDFRAPSSHVPHGKTNNNVYNKVAREEMIKEDEDFGYKMKRKVCPLVSVTTKMNLLMRRVNPNRFIKQSDKCQ